VLDSMSRCHDTHCWSLVHGPRLCESRFVYSDIGVSVRLFPDNGDCGCRGSREIQGKIGQKWHDRPRQAGMYATCEAALPACKDIS
jgi:hypothetical protein